MPEGAVQPYKGRNADAVIDQALKLYEEQGIEIADAAQQLDVPARTIHRWLATNALERWREAQQARALSDFAEARKARSEASAALNTLKATLESEGVEEAQERKWRLAHVTAVLDAADVALNHQKWLLERLLTRLYGQKQEVTLQAGSSLIGLLSNLDSVPRVVEGETLEAE